MAKGKSVNSYISKGQRPNISRKICNDIRRRRRADPLIEDILKRYFHRKEIIDKPRGKKQHELRDRYIEEERLSLQAFKLTDQYREVGLSKAEAMQAVKTNYTERLHAKWSPIIQRFRDSRK